MSDLISRQAAIDALGEEPPVWYDGEDELAERNQWRRDVDAIKAVPAADVVPWEWLERYAAEKRLTLASVFVAQAREMYEERIHCGYVRGERDD